VAKTHSSTLPDTVRQAMDVVLEAEHHAQTELAACRRDADAQLAEAREASRRIQHRTQERITRLHQACEETTAARVRTMKQAAVEAPDAIRTDSAEQALVREAAARLAARLTKAEDGH